MARYLVQASYTREAISTLVKNPEDRAGAIRPVVEGLGGKLEAFYFSFGDYDIVAIADLPDNVTMAALSMAVSCGGAVSSFNTTTLLTMEEGVAAMKKAGSIGYKSPGK